MFFYRNPLKWVQDQKLTASFDADPACDRFGASVSVASQDGRILAIGASTDEENGGDRAGSVYIFQNSSVGYQQVQKLTASFDTKGQPEIDFEYDYFGGTISMNATGYIIAIGAHNDEENGAGYGTFGGAGAVYIFQSGSQGYQQIQKLTSSADATFDIEFGRENISINATGDTLAIGASSHQNGTFAGVVYIFQSSSLGYQEVQKLTASFGTDGQPEVSPEYDWFGSSVSMNTTGDTLAIGAAGDEENGGSEAGSVYIFQSSSLGYQEVQKLTASFDTKGQPEIDFEYDRFGSKISMNATGDKMAIAAPYDEENGAGSGTYGGAGAVYIFQSGSQGYQQVQKLTSSGDGDPAGDRFSRNISMNTTGDILAIGAYGDDENGESAGAVYIFQSSSIGYQEVQKLTARFDTDKTPETDPAGDWFGFDLSVKTAGDILAISARKDEENGVEAGAVYIFKLTRDY